MRHSRFYRTGQTNGRRTPGGLPNHQRLVGLWLLLGGVSLTGGVLFAVWLESRLVLAPLERLLLWLGALSGGVTLLAVGYGLERYVFAPLRALHAALGRLLAQPDQPVITPSGWLASLGPDLRQIAKRWQADRARLETLCDLRSELMFSRRAEEELTPERQSIPPIGVPGSLDQQTLHSLDIVAFDTETTGLDLRGGDTLLSIGACRIVDGRLLASDAFDHVIDPQRPIPPASTAIHGIRNEDVEGAATQASVLDAFGRYTREAVLLAHNASFDLLALSLAGARPAQPVLDTLLISKALDPALIGHDLDTLAKRYGLDAHFSRHTALGDAQLAATLWLCLLPRLEARNIHTLSELLDFQRNAFDPADGHA